MIKGESSCWANKAKLVKQSFEWANEYFAVSISESHIYAVNEYIKNQEEHHRKKSWEDESNEFIDKYGFIRVNE